MADDLFSALKPPPADKISNKKLVATAQTVTAKARLASSTELNWPISFRIPFLSDGRSTSKASS